MRKVQDILAACRIQYRVAQKELDLALNVGMVIDEVAVYFDRTWELDAFLNEAPEYGWIANSGESVSHDEMYQLFGNSSRGVRNAGGHAFDVRFEFLHKEGVPYRIEAMHVIDGWAPLHRRMESSDIAHVSGKVTAGNSTAYAALKCALGSSGLPMMAEYRNSYGLFSYFGERAPHFKPRCNMRDA